MPYGMPPFAQSLSDDEVAVRQLHPHRMGQSRDAVNASKRMVCAPLRLIEALMINSPLPPAALDEARDADIEAISRTARAAR